MALSLAGGMVRDQNLNVNFNGVSAGNPNALKSQRNRGLGARKPLGDLSNAGGPSKDTCGGVSKKPKIGRKALSDISNSGKPQSSNISKKKQNVKLSAVSEESTEGETFLHNHHECVKAQMKAIDMDEFLQTLGLDNGLHKPMPSPLCNKSKFESPLKYLELDEMDEPLLEDQFTLKTEFPDNLHSPQPCRTPKSASHFAASLWGCENSDFAFIETPKLSKH